MDRWYMSKQFFFKLKITFLVSFTREIWGI
jgi:hypothetical protein